LIGDLTERVGSLEKDVEWLKNNQGSGGPTIDGDVIIQINNKIKNMEVKMDDLDKDMNRKLADLISQLSKGGKPTVQMQQQPADDSKTKELEQRLNALTSDYEKFKNDIIKWIKDLQDQLNQKADLD
jgi:hypothetical protein